MAYNDLREWIAKLEEEGELKRIKAEVDWNLEIGAIAQRAYDMKDKAPALLFENIKDYHNTHGKKFFTGSLTTNSRIALTLGLPKDTHPRQIIQTVRSRIKNPVKPVLVKTGPCKEVIEKGDDVNILEFPVPKWHDLDGGRYINTFGGVLVKHPQTGWMNLGIYRGMVVDKKTIAWFLILGKHWGHVYYEYIKLGKPMPVAVVYGWDPVLPFCACAAYPAGVSEYDMMGAMRQKPVELVRCETVDLEVPATAEIILEGYIPVDPKTYVMEGPFGEFPGYYTGSVSPKPIMNITCVTHRKDPIFQGTLEGRPPHEDSRCGSISMSAIAWDNLEKMGVPGITDVFCPPAVGNGGTVRVQINKRYNGHAKQVAACIWASAVSQYKYVFVAEEDIDIHDPGDVEWAIAYRVDPKEDVIVFPGMPGSPLDPSNGPRDNIISVYGGARWNRLLIDATRSWRWGPREEWGGQTFAQKVEVSPEMKRRVEDRAKELGF